MSISDKYELVVGIEIHAQLLTQTKAYSSDSAEFGGAPNTQVSPTSLGLPGALPVFNEKVAEFAVMLGLAVGAEIRYENQFARKSYFYADLPKGYQITQDKTPICTGGSITIKDDNGNDKVIRLERIHMEEDAGKSMHDQDLHDSLIDLNRAGVPLLEIVSKPDIRTPQEAYNYVTEVRKLLRHLEICDGNMEEGSMRCDVNVSVKLKDAEQFGQRTETKNLNSIRNVQRAIQYEMQRQIEVLERGGVISQETMAFDAFTGKTSSMRSKEMAHDYRYFPEPDLQPVYISQAYIESVKSSMPALPSELFKKYTEQYALPSYDAYQLTENKQESVYFEQIIEHTQNYKSAANWMMSTIKSYLNENGISIQEFPLSPKVIAQLINLVDDKKVSHTVAANTLFPQLIQHTTKDAFELAKELNVLQESDAGAIEKIVDEVLASFPDEVARYKEGKTNLLQMFVGQVMRQSKGKADPKIATQILTEKLTQ